MEENEEEDIEIKSVVKEYEKLRSEIFPHFKVKMVHGKLQLMKKESLGRISEWDCGFACCFIGC